MILLGSFELRHPATVCVPSSCSFILGSRTSSDIMFGSVVKGKPAAFISAMICRGVDETNSFADWRSYTMNSRKFASQKSFIEARPTEMLAEIGDHVRHELNDNQAWHIGLERGHERQ